MPILSNLIVRIGATTQDFDKAVDRSLNKIKRFASEVTAAGTALSLGFSLPLIAAGGAAIKAASDMESLTMGLKSVMKSAEATGTEMEKLRVLAKMPGIGLEDAVRGSIRLQILGRSADSARKVMGELANAIAISGGAADDFKVISQQLVQMESLGKITAENLNIIKERMPAVSKIMNDTWGPEAAADPAKFFKSIGLNSTQVIDIIIKKMAEGERAGNSFKNSWDNLEQAARDAAATFGEVLLPVAQHVMDDFLTPAIAKVKEMAVSFKALDQPAKDWAITIAAIAISVPLVITGMGFMVEKAALLVGVMLKVGTYFTAAYTAMATFGIAANVVVANMAGVAAGTAAASLAMGLFVAGVFVAVGSIAYLIDAFVQLNRAQDLVRKAEEQSVQVGAMLAAKISARNAEAAAQVKTYDGLLKIGVMTQEAYNGKLRELAKTLPDVTFAAAAAGVKKTGEAVAAAKIIVDSYAETKFDKLNRQFADGKISVENYKLEQEKLAVVMRDGLMPGRMVGDMLSGTSLAAVEGMERVKSAVGKVKDAMYEWAVQGTITGKKMEEWRAPLGHLVLDVERLDTAIHTAMVGMDMLSNLRPPQIDISAAGRSAQSRVGITGSNNAASTLGFESDQQRYQRIQNLQKANDEIREMHRVGMATGTDVAHAQQKLNEAIKGTTNSTKAQKEAMKQVSLVVNDLAKGITDVIFKGGKLADMFKNVAMQAAQSITRILIEGALMNLGKKLLHVGGLMGTIFSGGGAAAAAVPALNPIINAAGGIAGAAGGVASVAGSASSKVGSAISSANPIVGMVTAVSSVVSAISAVVANFQFAAMNKSLDLIERYTRYTQIYTGEQGQSILWSTQTTAERLNYVNASLDTIGKYSSEMLANLQQINAKGGMGGGSTFNIAVTGGDTRAVMESLTRMLKLHGAIPANA